jgi:sugar lactone lactonase YvrE
VNPTSSSARAWIFALATIAAPLHAQDHPASGVATAPAAPQADSAREARAAYRRAAMAYRNKDLVTARREMTSAATWWPGQQAYLEGAAQLAALARDTVDAARWLGRLAALGVGPLLDRDTTFGALAGAPVFDSALARLRSATAPVPRSRVRLVVPDTMLHPEGIAFDARSGRWFIGSVRQRRIVVVGRDGAARDFVRPGADGIAGVFGMAVDTARRTLWVATTALPRVEGFAASDSGRVGVYGYDLESGRLRRKAWMPRDSSTVHTFGDVAVASNGDVYVSDSQAPWIAKLTLGADSLERFATHPLFRSLQGMAITADDRTMFVADYSHGLLRVDLSSRSVTVLGSPVSATTLGVDGLYLHRGALIGVQNGVTPPRLVRFCLDASARRVSRVETLDRNPSIVDEPTLGAVVGDSVFYVATSEWEKFDDSGKRVAGPALRPAMVVGLALDRSKGCERE